MIDVHIRSADAPPPTYADEGFTLPGFGMGIS